jgi:lipopolysaccharide transport system permease protein
MHFRRGLLPVSTALTEACGFAGSLALLALMMAVYHVTPTLSILWLPPTLIITVIFGMAVAFPMTLVGVWAPDMTGLMLSVVRAAYFLAPGLVTLATIHGETNSLVRLNPLTALFEAFRHAVLYRSTPPAWELLYPLGAALVMFAVFLPIYTREARHFAKVLE